MNILKITRRVLVDGTHTHTNMETVSTINSVCFFQGRTHTVEFVILPANRDTAVKAELYSSRFVFDLWSELH